MSGALGAITTLAYNKLSLNRILRVNNFCINDLGQESYELIKSEALDKKEILLDKRLILDDLQNQRYKTIEGYIITYSEIAVIKNSSRCDK
jgi:hypothetical protein